MISNKNVSRILGGAFLLQIFAPLIGVLIFLQPLLVEENIVETMANMADNPSQVLFSILFQLFAVLGIGIIGALMYYFLKKFNKPMAIIAKMFYTFEATILAVSQVFLYALLLLSKEFQNLGGNESLEILAKLFIQLHDFTSQIHMFFFTFGACIYYILFLKSNIIPKALAFLGIIAASMSVIGMIFAILGFNVPIYVFILSLPFELITGFWFIFKGIPEDSIKKIEFSKK